MPKNKSPAKRAAAKSPAKIASVPKVPAAESKAAAEDDKGEASGDQSEFSDEYSDEDEDDQDRDDAQFEEAANFPNADAADGFGGAGAERFSLTADGGGIVRTPAGAGSSATTPKDSKEIIKALKLFAAKLQEYNKDSVSDFGYFLATIGQTPSKLDPLPPNAVILSDALGGQLEPGALVKTLTPVFIKTIGELGLAASDVIAATDAVNTIMQLRNACDRGRMLALTSQLAELHGKGGSVRGGVALGAADYSAEDKSLQERAGPALGISVMFTNIDKEAHKLRSTHRPTDNTPEQVEMLKQALIAVLNGNPSRAAEQIDLYAQKTGTQGVSSRLLLSTRLSVAQGIDLGAYQFAADGSSGGTLGAFTVNIAGPATASTVGELTSLPVQFERNARLAEEVKLLDEIKTGKTLIAGGKRDGNKLTLVLTGDTHRNQQARTLLQEKATHGLVEAARTIKFPDGSMTSTVREIARVYAKALKNESGDIEAMQLASASEFNCSLDPRALILASINPYMNIATNFLAEFSRAVTDAHNLRFLGHLGTLAQARAKPNETAQDMYARLEQSRTEMKMRQLPDVNFPKIGFSIDPGTGLPMIVHSPALNILTVSNHLYNELVKAEPNSRVREVFTPELFKKAQKGDLTAAEFAAALTKTNELKIPTAIAVRGAGNEPENEGKQQRQIGAFVAEKRTHASFDKSSVKPQQTPVKFQDRGRTQFKASDEKHVRSRSQDTTTVAHYKRGVGYATKHGALKFLQTLNDQCTALGEAILTVDPKGGVVTPIQLTAAHTWGQFGGKYAVTTGNIVDSEVFASLMLARDIFGGSSRLTRTGAQYSIDSDATWSKTKACSLRGDLAVATVNGKGKGGGKGSGKGYGKGKTKFVVAAAASGSLFGDDSESGEEE